MPESWETVLDELERRIASQDSSEWTPPADLGPLPVTLARRAERLLADQRAFILHASTELDRIGNDLAALRPGTGASGAAAFIDTVA